MHASNEVQPKPPFPTATIHSIRLRLFQATRRPVPLKKEKIETPWGIIRITGTLGQAHADVLDAICYVREKRATLEDGRIKVLVDPARVRERCGIESGEQFKNIIDDLTQATLEIIEPERFACVGHIIDHIDKAMTPEGVYITRPNPGGAVRGERHLWRVEFGKAFCKLVAGDIWLGYDPAPIAALDHGISQAVARHVLTHKEMPKGGWKLDTLIRAVAGEISKQTIKDRRRELRKDAQALATLGIAIENDRVITTDALVQRKCSNHQND